MCHLAAKNGHSLCLGLLVYYGANLQTKTLHGWEPIHLAAYHGHLGTLDWKKISYSVINIILHPYFKYDICNCGLKNHFAEKYESWKDCLTILLKAKVEINTTNHYGQTPLMMSVGENHVSCAKELLRWNSDTQLESLKKQKASDLVKSSEMNKIMVM